jgi:O-antigen ligase
MALLAGPVSLPLLGELGPVLSLAAVALVLSLLVCGPELLAARWPATRVDWLIVAYVAVIAATGLAGVSRTRTLEAAIVAAGEIGLFYSTVIIARRTAAAGAFLLALVVGAALVELMALAYHLDVGISTRPKEYPVPAGWSGYPELAALAVLQLGVLVGAALAAARPLERLVGAGLALVASVQIVLLYARAGWAAALAIGAGALLIGRQLRVRALAAGGALAAVLAVFVLTQPTVRVLAGNLLGLQASPDAPVIEMATPSMRVDLWRKTLRMIGDRPIQGVGLGNFRPVFESQYNPELNPDQRRGVHAHNLWLHRTAELGIPGGLCLAAIWGVLLGLAWRAARLRQTAVAAGVFLALVGATAINLVDTVPAMVAGLRIDMLIWMLFGIAAADDARP